ncbi:MAG: hypothetical protein IJF39_00815, partial [Clostridia bacterium]|nr:hypothetical protein [Clostridia bacterium]
MNKKMFLGSVVSFAAAFMCVACMGVVLLDLGVLNMTESSLQGSDGLGMAIIFSLAVSIQYPVMVVALLLQVLVGILLLLHSIRGGTVHIAWIVLNMIGCVLAAAAGGFFAVCYFDIGIVLWGSLTLCAAALSFFSGLVAIFTNRED